MTEVKMVQAQNAVVKPKPDDRGRKNGYLPKWVHVLNAPLIPTYLEALRVSLDHRHVPSPMIVQSLLYFTLVPPTVTSDCPSPVELLGKIRSHHLADLNRSECLPTYPRNRDTPRWLKWEADSPTERHIQRYMTRASDEGIWGLLWDQGEGSRRKRADGLPRRRIKGRGQEQAQVRVRVQEVDDEDDGDEELKVEKKVSQQGWKLLEWLVGYWEEDQKQSGLDYSPAFLAQLPKQRDMQYDNPSLPLAVIQSALSDPGSSHQPARSEIASRIMGLLINTAIPPSPPFHPSTLILSLLPLLRTPLPGLNDVLNLFRGVPETVYAHFLIHAIEDLAGLRATKAAERRSRRARPRAGAGADAKAKDDFANAPGQIGNFPPPTVEYTKQALLYPPRSTSTQSGQSQPPAMGEMMALKFNLVSTMVNLFPKAPEWKSMLEGKSWKRDFDRLALSFTTPHEEEMGLLIMLAMETNVS